MRQQIGMGPKYKYRKNPEMFLYYRQPVFSCSPKCESRYLRANSGKIMPNNPQRSYQFQQIQKSSISYLQAKQRERPLCEQRSQRIYRFPKLSLKSESNNRDQDISQGDLTQQQLLAERARQFISRIQKQKKYHYGKAVFRKRKQEDSRRNKQKQDEQIRTRHQRYLKESRFEKIFENILVHQERITQRIKNTISRYRQSALRAKTETEDIPMAQKRRSSESQSAVYQGNDSSYSVMHYSPVVSLKKKVKS